MILENFKIILLNVRAFFCRCFSKNNRFITIFILSVTALLILFVFVGGYVSFTAPVYRIENQEDFDLMRRHPNATFRLTKQNIEITGKWTPIGTKEQPFTGELNGLIDGKRCSISFNLDTYDFVADGDDQYFGLFGVNNGTIRDVQIYFSDDFKAVISDSEIVHFGLFAGINNGSISHCNIIYTKSTNIESPTRVNFGCFAGSGMGNYINLYVKNINHSFRSDSFICAGGICGMITGQCKFDQCWVQGIFKDSSDEKGFAGGFVGRTLDKDSCYIVNSLSEIRISGNCDCGGIIGDNASILKIEKTYSKATFGDVSGSIGGFIGTYNGSVVLNDSLSNVMCGNLNSLAAFFDVGSSAKIETINCYWIRNTNIDSLFGQVESLSNLTLDVLKWDNSIWNKNVDFYLK